MGMDMMNAADGGDRRGSRLAATKAARRAAIGRSRGYWSRGQGRPMSNIWHSRKGIGSVRELAHRCRS